MVSCTDEIAGTSRRFCPPEIPPTSTPSIHTCMLPSARAETAHSRHTQRPVGSEVVELVTRPCPPMLLKVTIFPFLSTPTSTALKDPCVWRAYNRFSSSPVGDGR